MSPFLNPSSPGLSRGSTSGRLHETLKPRPDVDGRDKPGHDEIIKPWNQKKRCVNALAAKQARVYNPGNAATTARSAAAARVAQSPDSVT